MTDTNPHVSQRDRDLLEDRLPDIEEPPAEPLLLSHDERQAS
jgi:hypothetical protein